jgi:osmotically-inducible protein OsmY
VRSVRDVVNHLTVTIPGTEAQSDAALAQAVRQALEGEPSIPT